MAIKNGIVYSPLTDKVYLGKQNVGKRMWLGQKKDVTDDFITVALEFFEENCLREISSVDNDKSNLFVNVKNDKASINKLINNLRKRLENLK